MDRRCTMLPCMVLVFVGLTLGLVADGHAASTLYWDPTSTLSSSGSGAGTWNYGIADWWISGSSDTTWTDVTGTDTAVFGGPAGATITTSGNLTANAIVFNAAGYTLSGGSITLAGVSPTITANASSDTISAIVSGSNGLTLAGTGNLTLLGVSGLAGTVTQAGSGLTTLSGASINYSGPTTITSGTVGLQGTTAFASTITVNPTGVLNLSSSTVFASRAPITKLITGSGIINVNNSGSGVSGGWITFNAATVGLSNFTGTVNVNSGVLSMDDTLGSWSGSPNLNVVAGGVFAIRDQNITVGTLTGNGDVGDVYSGDTAGHTLTVNSGSFSGVIHGSTAGGTDGQIEQGYLSLAKTGTGLLVLSGLNTYSGGTSITGGTVQLGSATALGASSGSLGMFGSLLNLAGNSLSVGTFSGSGTIDNISAGGAVTLTVGNASTSNTTFSGNLQNSSGTIALVKAGSGALLLSGTNSYSGGTTITGGALAFASTSAFPTLPATHAITIAGGALAATGPYTTANGWFNSGLVTPNPTSGAIALTGIDSENINFSSGTAANYANLSVGAYGSATYSGILTPSGTSYNLGGGGGTLFFTPTISGPSGLSIAGPGVVALTSTANSFSGGTSISSGTLQVGDGATSLGSLPGLIADNGVLQFATPSALTYSATNLISGNGGLAKSGAGVLVLVNSASYTGTTTISAGTLQIGNGASGEGLASSSIANAANLTFNNADSMTYSGAISGVGTLQKLGAGSVVLGGALSYTGATTVTAGTLQLSSFTVPSNGGNPISTTIASGATLIATGPITLQGTASADALVPQLTGSGTLQLAANSSLASPDFYSNTYLNAGYGVLENVSINLGANTTRWMTGQAYGNDYGEYGCGDLGLFGKLTGTNVNVTVEGTGTSVYSGAAFDLVLGNNNSGWTGPLTVVQGQVALANSAALSSANDVYLNTTGTNYAQLYLFGNNVTIGSLYGTGTGTRSIRNGAWSGGYGTHSNATLTVDQSMVGTFSGVISNGPNDYEGGQSETYYTLGLNKAGPSTLVLAGANTFTGGTTVSSGTLGLGFNFTGAPLANILPATGPVTFAGGTLYLSGSASATNSQTLGSLTFNPGESTIVLAPASGNTLTLNATSTWTHNAGSSVNIVPGTGTINVGSLANTNGIIGGYVTINGSDWAAVSSSAVTALSSYTTPLATSGNNSPVNYSTTGSTTLTANLTVNTLKVLTSAGTGTLSIPTGDSLTLSGNGLLITGTSAYTISGGSITAGSGVGSNDLIVQQFGSGALTMASVISNSGATPVNLVMAGTGTMILATTNSYSGSTYLDGGVLQFSNSAQLGAAASPLVFSGGTIRYSGNTDDLSLEKTLTFNAAGATIDTNGQNVTFSTAVGNNGIGGLTKVGLGTLTLSATSNSFSGPFTINGGSVSVAALGNEGAASPLGSGDNVNFGGGTLLYTGPSTTTNRIFTFNAGGGTINVGNAASTVTLFGTMTGAGGFTKSGLGSLVLPVASATTNTGPTTVAGGNLIASSFTVPGVSSVLTIASGGTMTVTGPITLNGTSSSGNGNIRQIVGPGLLQLASTNSSLTNPDFYIPIGGNWGATTNVPINLGANTTRYITGSAGADDYGNYGTGDFGIFGPLSGTNVGVVIQGSTYAGGGGTAQFDVVLGNDNSNWSGPLTVSRGYVALTHTNALTAANDVIMNPAAGNVAGLYLFGYNTTIGNLSGTGAGIMDIRNGSGGGAYNGNNSNDTLTVTQSVSGTFAGVISNGPNDYYGGSATTNTTGLNKSGTAVLTITGTSSSYTGITSVSQGTLAFGYDAASAGPASLGAVPASATANNIILNGGVLSPYTSLTLNANRGIGLGATSGTTGGGGTLNVPSGATVLYNGTIASAGNSGINFFTKTGGGALYLGGYSTDTGISNFSGGSVYITGSISSGTTNINSATVNVNGSLSTGGFVNLVSGATLSGNGNIGATTVANGNVIDVSQNGDVSLSFGSLAFGQSSGDEATINFSSNNVNNPALNVTGLNGLTTNGTSGSVTLNIAGAAAVTGSYPLINFNGSVGGTGTSAFVLGTHPALSSRQTQSLVDTGNQIDWVVSGSYPVWTGANNGLWIGGTNWRLSGSTTPTDFLPQDTVVFDDSATGTTAVVIAGTGNVNPLSITFSNSQLNYSISGSNGIAGPATVALNGSGTVLIATSNTYTGGTTVSNGLLQIGNQSALGTGPLTLNGGSLTSSGATAYSIATPLVLNGSVTLGDPVNNGQLTFTAVGGTLASSSIVTINSPITIAGNLSGGLGVGLTVNGASTLTLLGSNSYPGTTTINSGTLQVGNGGAGASLGATSNVVDNGSLVFNIASSATVGQVISGFGSVTQAGSGVLTFSNTGNSYTGPTLISSGTLNVASVAIGGLNSSLGAATSNAGNLVLNGGELNYIGAGAGTTNRGITLGLSGGTLGNAAGLTLNGVITGSGSLLTTGAGPLTLNASNSYTGGTIFNGGSITLGNINGLGTGMLTIASNSSSNYFLYTTTLSGTQNLVNSISLPHDGSTRYVDADGGAGNVLQFSGTISGGGTGSVLLLNDSVANGAGIYRFSADNTFTAQVTLNRGALQIDHGDSLGSASNLVYLDSYSPNEIIFTNPMTYPYNTTIGYTTATFNTNGNTVASTGTISGGYALNVIGSGTFIPSGTNTYTGGTTISSATASVAFLNNSGLASNIGTGGVTLDNGDLQYTGSAQSTNRSIAVTANGGTIDASGSGPLNIAVSAISLTGTASHSLTLTGTNTGINTLSSQLTDFNGNSFYPSSLTKSGPGTWVIANASNTYSGGTNIQAGTLVAGVTYALPATGTVTFGSSTTGGTLDLNGQYQAIGGLAVAPGANSASQVIFNSNTSQDATLVVAAIGVGSFGGSIQDSANSGNGSIGFTLQSGDLTFTGSNNTYSGGTTIISGASLRMGAVGSLPSQAVTVNGTLDLAGLNLNVAALNGAGIIDNQNVVSSGSVNLLKVGSGNASSAFSGIIQNTSGTIALVKSGTGSFTLLGANTYSGNTVIHAGTLLAGAANSLPITTNVIVSGGTLDVSNFSQQVGSLTMGSSAALNINVGNLFTVTGSSSLAGTLNILNGLSYSSGSAELLALSGSYSGTFRTNGLPSGYALQYLPTQIDLIQTGPASATWIGPSTGSWNTPSNWSSNAVPNSQGAIAVLGSVTTSPTTITLDSPQTLGMLTFASSAGYSLLTGNSGRLTLDNTGGTGNSQIIVLAGTHSIAAPLTISNGPAFISLVNSGSLDISGSIGDGGNNHSLSLSSSDASGTLSLDGSNSFSGGVYVNSGTLVLNGAASLAPGSALAIGATSPPSTPSAISSPVAAPNVSLAPVPEPGTLTLFGVAALWSAVACYRRRKANVQGTRYDVQ